MDNLLKEIVVLNVTFTRFPVVRRLKNKKCEQITNIELGILVNLECTLINM